jgi:hypothetical protein
MCSFQNVRRSFILKNALAADRSDSATADAQIIARQHLSAFRTQV